jgi:broad specificity phosphatase PhoE
MSRLFLIRHGESAANKDRSVYLTVRDHNIPLTDIGQSQATECGIKLRPMLYGSKVSVFVSPYLRTRETWQAIKKELYADQSLVESENPLLREQEYKIFTDEQEVILKKQEREEFGPFFYRYKNAESTADVYLRVQTFLNYLILQKINGQLRENVVVVAHEVVLRMFLMILDRLPHEKAKVDIMNCEIVERDI